jgi:hypothetical protein
LYGLFIENFELIDYHIGNMGKVSFKAIIRAVSYALSIMALSGCIMEPVNLTGFVEDDEVIEIIDRGAGKVFPAREPDGQENPNLIGGNGKITVLYDSEYYIIDYYGENPQEGKEPIIMFAAADGTCTEPLDLAGIGRLTGKEKVITGLTNYHTYNVRPAQVLTGNVSYYDLAGLVGGSPEKQIAPIIEGAIYIKPPEIGGYIFFTPPLPPPAPIGNYDIVKAPVSPAGQTASVPLISGDILTEAAGEMEIDYVFYDRVIKTLYVLKVIITNEEPPTPPEPEDLTIRVTLSNIGDNSPVPDKTTYSYYQIDDLEETFTIADAGNYTDIKWYIMGEEADPEDIGPGNSFILKKHKTKYKIIGVYIITVEAVREGIPYSAAIEVTVRE